MMTYVSSVSRNYHYKVFLFRRVCVFSETDVRGLLRVVLRASAVVKFIHHTNSEMQVPFFTFGYFQWMTLGGN